MSDIIIANQTDALASSKKPKEPVREWVGILGGATLIFLTAALFAAGRGNRAGYLYQIGFDLSQAPDDFYSTLYWGYVATTPKILGGLIAAVIALFLLAALSWIGDWVWTRVVRKWSWLNKISTALLSTPTSPPRTHTWMVALAVLTICFSYFVFLSYWMMAGVHEEGTEKGKKLIAALEADPAAAAAKNGTQWIEISLDSSPARIEKGYRLLCTERLCSIYDPTPESRGVRLVSLENMKEIQIGQRGR